MRKKEEKSRMAYITACSESRRFARAMKHRLGYSPPPYFLWSEEDEDEVDVTPDTPEWFDWLDGLTCFFFDGKDGDFTACKQSVSRPDEPAYWIASQQWGEKEYKRNLGQTSDLTTFHLEEVAADMEAEVSENEIGGTGEGDLHRLFIPSWKDSESKRYWYRIPYQCPLRNQQHDLSSQKALEYERNEKQHEDLYER